MSSRLQEPLLQPCLAEGVADDLCALADLGVLSRRQVFQYERKLKSREWLSSALARETIAAEMRPVSKSKRQAEIGWFRNETLNRLEAIHRLVSSYSPWKLPEYSSLRDDRIVGVLSKENPSLHYLPRFIDDLRDRLDRAIPTASPEETTSLRKSEAVAPASPVACDSVGGIELRSLAAEAAKFADEMDFGFLLNPRRKLMSVGFNAHRRNSNRRVMTCWLRSRVRLCLWRSPRKTYLRSAGSAWTRPHSRDHGRPILLSWTGTMFEYLMPTMWMRSYSNTLLDRSRIAAAAMQQEYGASKGVPWGISESAYLKLNEAGDYQYQAFGLPRLALMKTGVESTRHLSLLDISGVDGGFPRGARQPSPHGEALGWFGAYGFYEAADYTAPGFLRRLRCRLVLSWMAHHQGMSLLSMANLLCDNVVQRWFHADRRVQATELLLQEKPISQMVEA